jgi:hypothetical protein
MDKDSATVTKWANCSDLPVIEHLIQELSNARSTQRIESMSSNASMEDGSARNQTPRKIEMGVQTILSRTELEQMEVNSLLMKKQFK